MAELWPREPRNIPLWQQIGRQMATNWNRWAGLSGATAIVFTAYLENDGKLTNFDKHYIGLANQINYIHALVLLAMPIARCPNLSGSLFLLGMVVYCLGCYLCALFEFNGYLLLSSIGGIILIVAWLTLLF